MSVVFYFLCGAIAGTLSGLFGIGGGLILVPSLLFIFHFLSVPTHILVHMAVGTSLATIVITSLSAGLAHHAKGNVCWDLLVWLVPGTLIGAWAGVSTAIRLSGHILQFFFGIFVLCMVVKMLMTLHVTPSNNAAIKKKYFSLAGVLIGWLAGLFGIGGGALTVPFIRSTGISIKKAVGTSAACGFPIAVAGTISNIFLPHNIISFKHASGFVYWPAVVGIIITSIPSARFGARLAQKIDAKRLQKSFAFFLLLVSLRLLWPSFNSLFFYLSTGL